MPCSVLSFSKTGNKKPGPQRWVDGDGCGDGERQLVRSFIRIAAQLLFPNNEDLAAIVASPSCKSPLRRGGKGEAVDVAVNYARTRISVLGPRVVGWNPLPPLSATRHCRDETGLGGRSSRLCLSASTKMLSVVGKKKRPPQSHTPVRQDKEG